MADGEITIVIDENGASEIKVTGVPGTGCKALTADLEDKLGTVVKDTPTREMREVNSVKHRNIA